MYLLNICGGENNSSGLFVKSFGVCVFQPFMLLVMAAVATAAALIEREENRRMTRRYWVHPVVANREEHGQFRVIYHELCTHEEKYFNYT